VNEQPAITVPYVVHEEVPAPRLVLMEVTLTGYCPCTKCTGKNGPWNKRTTRYGDLAIVCDGVAADPGVLVPRSRIYIPGIGWREVDDIGGDIKGHRLDVRFPDHESALRFGIHRKVIVGVLVA
jgi:3D (Asp-Asp-Asp) domain-containing protein